MNKMNPSAPKRTLPAGLVVRKRKASMPGFLATKKARSFFDTYRHQTFPLPDSMMHYISKNPSSLKLYQKLVQTCKYFFWKNPILPVEDFYHYTGEKWTTSDDYLMDLANNISKKLWISGEFRVLYFGNSYRLSSIMPKIYRCDVNELNLFNQVIYYRDFRFLTSAIVKINMNQTIVKNDDESITPFEDLVAALLKIKNLVTKSDVPLLSINSNTFNELVALPHFSKIEYFGLEKIPEAFDLEAFYVYMKTNKLTKFSLFFADQLSNAYKNGIEQIVDEIVGTQNHGYEIPCLSFPRLNGGKWIKLYRLYK